MIEHSVKGREVGSEPWFTPQATRPSPAGCKRSPGAVAAGTAHGAQLLGKDGLDPPVFSREPLAYCPSNRRTLLAAAAGLAVMGRALPTWAAGTSHPDRAWMEEAIRMRELAESWGDQRFGAVVVVQGRLVGLGPSRVIRDRDPSAHAERVAIRSAQVASGTQRLADAVLYSTSRPCPACEQAAAAAGVRRMVFGESLQDAGPPQAR